MENESVKGIAVNYEPNTPKTSIVVLLLQKYYAHCYMLLNVYVFQAGWYFISLQSDK